MNTYFFIDGIRQLASESDGSENVYLGIRPYGFHAGNMLPHVVYPLLLCRELADLGKVPRFKFWVFVNDWEQDKLAGPNVEIYPFNVFPIGKTFQFVSHPTDPNKNIVDFWEPIITQNLTRIQTEFPKVEIHLVRNSAMKNHPTMRKQLLFTLTNPKLIADILQLNTGKKILEKPISFILAVCPSCHYVKGATRTGQDGKIWHECEECGTRSTGEYEKFEFWFYHKPLAIPRLEIFDIDICITGFDHYAEGDYGIRRDLIRLFGSSAKFPKTLYSPILLGRDGRIMGKSRGNAELADLQDLMRLALSNSRENKIRLPDHIKTFNMSATITSEPLRPTSRINFA